MQWYLDVLKKYVMFDGRARRKEFWMFVLFSVIITIILWAIDRLIGTDYNNGRNGLLTSIYGLAVLLPTLGVAARRMHDKDRSGWWILIWLIPCIGQIWFIIWQAQEGTPGDNRFGPDPKAAERFGGPSGAGPTEPGYPTV